MTQWSPAFGGCLGKKTVWDGLFKSVDLGKLVHKMILSSGVFDQLNYM